jgi:uncharacterized membrane protein YeiH
VITTLDIIATFAFALVGARVAADRRMDYGGILLVATVASITGGTLRNIFLQERPIWLEKPWYLIAILAAVAITIILKTTTPVGSFILLLDSIGLAVATVSGVQYSIDKEVPLYAGIVLGTISAVAGGLLRDLLCQVEPVLLHRETIGTSCVLGASVYVLIQQSDLNSTANAIFSGLIIVIFRSISIKYKWNLPKIK